MSQKEEQTALEAVGNESLLDMHLFMLSRLYEVLCDCRNYYPELEDLLNPIFHLEECPYRIKLEPLNLNFENE